MTDKEFLRWVEASRWREAKSSPHQYTIKHWHGDRAAFLRAVKHVRANGTPGVWNGETFVYLYPGDGYRYFDAAPNSGPERVVAFNRAAVDVGQPALWQDTARGEEVYR